MEEIKINCLKFGEYKNGEESQFISNVEVHAICGKLRELGVEVIERFSDKIEFEWHQHICTYKNRTFYCGTKNMFTFENISDLNTNALDCLVGKLTDEQLNRVGNLIDLYEEQINHNLSLLEDMASICMMETKLYQKKEQDLAGYRFMIVKLQKLFHTGILEDRLKFDILSYILKGE